MIRGGDYLGTNVPLRGTQAHFFFIERECFRDVAIATAMHVHQTECHSRVEILENRLQRPARKQFSGGFRYGVRCLIPVCASHCFVASTSFRPAHLLLRGLQYTLVLAYVGTVTSYPFLWPRGAVCSPSGIQRALAFILVRLNWRASIRGAEIEPYQIQDLINSLTD